MLPGLVVKGGSGVGLTSVVFLSGFSPADVILVTFILFSFYTPTFASQLSFGTSHHTTWTDANFDPYYESCRYEG